MKTKTKTTVVKVRAAQYEDHDNCLEAAAADYVETHPEAKGWDLNARWQDESREVILLDAPVLL